MDELLIRVLPRLLRVHEELGEHSFEEAAHRALLAIALSVRDEAEARAGEHPKRDAAVVSFPLAKARSTRSQELPGGDR